MNTKLIHDQVLAILLEQFSSRTEIKTQSNGLPSVNFLGVDQRTTDVNGRLSEGRWFLGNDKYLSISLSNVYTEAHITKVSMGINLETLEASLQFSSHGKTEEHVDVLKVMELFKARFHNGRKLTENHVVHCGGSETPTGKSYRKHYPGHYRHTLGRILGDWIAFKTEADMEGLYPVTL